MNLKLTLSIAVIILIVVFAGWYLYTQYVPEVSQLQQEQENAQNSNDTTASIESDLNQVPDDATVNGDMDSLDASLEAF